MDRKTARQMATELVAQMSLEEKASQLRYDAPAIPRLGIPEYNWWNEALHGVARAGTATVFPQAIGLAAIFDEDFQEKIADTVSTEARAKFNVQNARGDRDRYKGLTMWSPNINIFRDPRWGRGHETYGEDPYLTSRLGVRYIRGLQGKEKYLKTAACAKHFAAHSGPEAIRHEFNSVVSPKDLAETYLYAFEAAVKEGNVESVMGAYNSLNGEPACGSEFLLKKTLRGKWGFEGHVVSDCGAIKDFHTHYMVTATAPESAALALKNGCDINCGNTYLNLLEAVQEGLVTEEMITESCVRAFTTRFLLGLFAGDNEYDRIPYLSCDTDEANALALEAAEKSMVLLENDGILPLCAEKIRTIAVIGPNADNVRVLEGNYNGTSSRNVTFLQGIRTWCEARGIRVLYSVGCHLYKDNRESGARADDRIAEALAVAENADIVIACVGLDSSIEGEAGDANNAYGSGDKEHLMVPECQRRLMKALAGTGKKIVTVIAAGSSMNVPEGNAKLMAWYPGQAGGMALAEILFGEKCPGGHLPLTFYERVDDLPEFTDYRMENRTYRYFTGKPLYPFGHGLSYTKFTLDHVKQEGNTVSVSVSNTGKMRGDAVVQIYAKADSPFAALHPKLCGFGRVSLNAGETGTLVIALDKKTDQVVNDDGEWVPVSDVKLYVGFSQPDEQSVALSGFRPLEIPFR